MKNRQWLLTRRPHGLPVRNDFERRDTDITPNDLRSGELIVSNRLFLCAPTMRNWMSGQTNSLFPANPLDAPMTAPCAGVVEYSKNPDIPVGAKLTYFGAWQDYEFINPSEPDVTKLIADMRLVDAMGAYGLNSQTAYFGITHVGEPKVGDTVVVSGAAGSTGSTAAQISRIIGARVIGIAGGPAKCQWLLDECKLDGAIDYKNESVHDRLAELCPDGIDVFYDNVGGDALQAAIDHMAKYGRIVLCGQIASYNDDELPEGPRNMMRVVYGSIRLQGFLRSDYLDHVEEAISQLRAWKEAGELIHRVDLRYGFDEIPLTFTDVLTGRNNGTLLIEIGDDPTA